MWTWQELDRIIMGFRGVSRRETKTMKVYSVHDINFCDTQAQNLF